MAIEKREIKPVNKLKFILNAESVKQQFENALRENAGPFIASIIDLYSSDRYLQQCDPNAVVMEALKAATLKLPINKQLGFAYIVPYTVKGKSVPQFQIGYKGYIQLAMRTGQYRCLNSGVVYEGIKVNRDLLTGRVTFEGEATSHSAQGYFAYMELINGFSKTEYMTKAEVLGHAKRYSKSYGKDGSAWNSNFDEMALKTVIRRLLSKYGILSTEMVTALTSTHDEEDVEFDVEREISENANGEIIDVELVPVDVEQEHEASEEAPEDGTASQMEAPF